MTEREAMLLTVLADPAADLPRLVFADWLDDRGEHERAEFIRVQVELDKPVRCDAFMHSCYEYGERCLCGDRFRLQERERELLSTKCEEGYRSWEWMGRTLVKAASPKVALCDQVVFRRGFVDEVRLPLAALFGGACGRCEGRGFYGRPDHDNPLSSYPPEHLTPEGLPRLTCPDCSGTGRTEGCAAALFGSQPVVSVVLTDREPSDLSPLRFGESETWLWQWDGTGSPDRPHRVPRELMLAMYELDQHTRYDHSASRQNTNLHFATRDAARRALSAAAVSLGRSLAGLDPLPTPAPAPAAV